MQNHKDSFTILSICHFIVGALSFLMSFVPFVYLVVGFALIIFPGGLETEGRDHEMLLGWVFLTIATLAILVGITIATATIFAGYFLSRQIRYPFCRVVAVIECLFFPFGTLLGVVTLILLHRDDYKQAFTKHSDSAFSYVD